MSARLPPPIPTLPLWLGAGGAVPFIVLAGSLWLLPVDQQMVAIEWLRAYAAVILSFVGAVHWAFAMLHPRLPDRDRDTVYAWSVVPALVAWVGLLLSVRPGLLLTAAMFVVQWTMDHQFVTRFGGVPDWYLRLRAGLTAVVSSCLVLVAMLR
jgi:hypothetical protein